MPGKVNLMQKFSLFHDYWSPKIVGELNDSYVKLAKLKGEFVWHHHDNEDELFLVLNGTLTMKLRDGDVEVREGEFIIIPKGVEHQPVAERSPSDAVRAEDDVERGQCQERSDGEKLEWI